ncbi:hypothetical protein T439DRAFT_378974 [Meredithblackwellia eburnea MCA 4105]
MSNSLPGTPRASTPLRHIQQSLFHRRTINHPARRHSISGNPLEAPKQFTGHAQDDIDHDSPSIQSSAHKIDQQKEEKTPAKLASSPTEPTLVASASVVAAGMVRSKTDDNLPLRSQHNQLQNHPSAPMTATSSTTSNFQQDAPPILILPPSLPPYPMPAQTGASHNPHMHPPLPFGFHPGFAPHPPHPHPIPVPVQAYHGIPSALPPYIPGNSSPPYSQHPREHCGATFYDQTTFHSRYPSFASEYSVSSPPSFYSYPSSDYGGYDSNCPSPWLGQGHMSPHLGHGFDPAYIYDANVVYGRTRTPPTPPEFAVTRGVVVNPSNNVRRVSLEVVPPSMAPQVPQHQAPQPRPQVPIPHMPMAPQMQLPPQVQMAPPQVLMPVIPQFAAWAGTPSRGVPHIPAPVKLSKPLVEPGQPTTPTLEKLEEGAVLRRTGTTKFFDITKGFGFVLDDKIDEIGGRDIFVHYTALLMKSGFRCLSNGEPVEYDLVKARVGGLQALNVCGTGGGNLRGLTEEQQALQARLEGPKDKKKEKKGFRRGPPVFTPHMNGMPVFIPYAYQMEPELTTTVEFTQDVEEATTAADTQDAATQTQFVVRVPPPGKRLVSAGVQDSATLSTNDGLVQDLKDPVVAVAVSITSIDSE